MLERLKIYIEYSKPKVWWLLVFTGLTGAVIATTELTEFNIILILIAVISVTLGSMGAEGLTNYIDLNMDSIMSRTKKRPLPRGSITKKNALIFGYSLSFFSVIILLAFGKYIASVFMAAGIFDNVFIYSYLLKKRSPYSIIYGGFSGAFPVLIGWYTLTLRFSWLPWILFLLVMFWIPVHVWSLAYRYRDDYKNANVPMLPVVYSDKKTAVAISIASLLLIAVSVMPYLFGIFNIIYLIMVIILSVPIVIFSIKFINKPDGNSSFRLFVYTAPYLTLIFLIAAVINFLKLFF